jgi:hypothetical protein
MFVLDGRTLSPDAPFTHNGVNYPSKWLRLSTLQEKQAIGIQELPDPPTWDQRFYWGYDQDGHLIPKDHAGLITLWNSQTKDTANKILFPTDWMIVREADNGTVCPADTKSWRQLIRTSCSTKLTNIEATVTTNELAAYITGSDYPVWPTETDINAPYSSWLQNSDTGKWSAPIPYPTDGLQFPYRTDGLQYEWNEAEQSWTEVVNQSE